MLNKLGKFTEAEASFHQAIKLDGTLAAPHNGLGKVLHKQGKLTEAEDSFRQAIKLDGTLAAPHNGLGNMFYEQGKFTEAEASFHESLVLDPENLIPHHGLGKLYQKLTFQNYPLTHLHWAAFAENRRVAKHLSSYISFFSEQAEAPLLLRRLFQRFPHVVSLAHYAPLVQCTQRQCHDLLAYLAHREQRSQPPDKPVNSDELRVYHRLKATLSYHGGDYQEAFYLFDMVLDKAYTLNLAELYYYFASTLSALAPPKAQESIFEEIQRASDYVRAYDNARDSLTELYYAGQILYLLGTSYQHKQQATWLAEAEACFRTAEKFTFLPASYQLVALYEHFNRPDERARQVEKVRNLEAKMKQGEVFLRGCPVQELPYDTSPDPFDCLRLFQRYSYFRELLPVLQRIHEEGEQYTIPSVTEAFRLRFSEDRYEYDEAKKEGILVEEGELTRCIGFSKNRLPPGLKLAWPSDLTRP